MFVIVTCGNCKKQFRVKPEFAGRWVSCAGCGEGILVPEAPPTTGDELTANLRQIRTALDVRDFATLTDILAHKMNRAVEQLTERLNWYYRSQVYKRSKSNASARATIEDQEDK